MTVRDAVLTRALKRRVFPRYDALAMELPRYARVSRALALLGPLATGAAGCVGTAYADPPPASTHCPAQRPQTSEACTRPTARYCYYPRFNCQCLATQDPSAPRRWTCRRTPSPTQGPLSPPDLPC